MQLIPLSALDTLIAVLGESGYRVVGPTVQDGAIVYGDISRGADLPIGWTDVQDNGSYRLERRSDQARFGYAVGPHSWKRFLFPPEVRLWHIRRKGPSFEVIDSGGQDGDKYAFFAVRSCEIHAMAIQDRVFLAGGGEPAADPLYAAGRRGAFVVAVQCTEPGGTCFCVSMGTGPTAETGFDLALTEVMAGEGHAGEGHYFTVEVGSERGREILARLPHRAATAEEIAAARRATERAAGAMGRTLDTAGIAELLHQNQDHPRWSEVAERCLSCANCTMSCPTCFCSTVEDHSDLSGQHAERWRRWDSCFDRDFSYLHGGSVRPSIRARYRQWATHKLASWFDQFGTSGCVGCGRCITWCPVGIDITEEVAAIRSTRQKGEPL